ncbi:MAG: hypothetical protein ACFB4I_24880 [Cyanophyceae cyanobacterium]
MESQQPSFSVPHFVQKIRQEIYSSIKLMVQTWQKRLKEDSLNPPATYQKPLHHQPKAKQGILYELPKNNPAHSLKEKHPQERVYSRSESAPQSGFNQFSSSNTLYEVNNYQSKTNLFYENTKASTTPYPRSLNFGYQKRSFTSVNESEKQNVKFQHLSQLKS